MIDETVSAEIRRLVLGEGWKVGTVARRLGVHHSVVRRVVCGEAAVKPRVAPVKKKHEPRQSQRTRTRPRRRSRTETQTSADLTE